MSESADAPASAADRLLAKVREFVASLEPEERSLFAALVGPGVALAFQPAVGEDDDLDEVSGFEMVEWRPGRLPSSLEHAIRDKDIRIEGL